MKFGFKLNNIELGKVKIGGIEINTEFSINEMVTMRKESELLLENLPEYLEKFAHAISVAQRINSEFCEEQMKEDLVRQALNNR